jgi:uncharacterized membrane protein (GlpM family)
MDYWYTLLKFVVGGAIVAGTTIIAEQIDPRYGGILATAPIITTIAFVFMYTETSPAATQQLVLNSFYFVIPTVLFLAGLYLMMNRYAFFPSLGAAYGIWIVALFLVNRLVVSA